jgi:hypothetical protein
LIVRSLGAAVPSARYSGGIRSWPSGVTGYANRWILASSTSARFSVKSSPASKPLGRAGARSCSLPAFKEMACNRASTCGASQSAAPAVTCNRCSGPCPDKLAQMGQPHRSLAHLRQMPAGEYPIMAQKACEVSEPTDSPSILPCQEVWHGACVTPSRKHETRTK